MLAWFILGRRRVMQVFFQKNPQIKHLWYKCFSVSLFYLTAFLKCEKQKQIRTDQSTSCSKTSMRWLSMDENVSGWMPSHVFSFVPGPAQVPAPWGNILDFFPLKSTSSFPLLPSHFLPGLMQFSASNQRSFRSFF